MTAAPSHAAAPVRAPAIRLAGLRRAYAQPRGRPARLALDGVSFDVPPGQFVALLGPNGSGKSTLLRILATLDAPDAGTITLAGHSLASPAGRTAARRLLGVAFQSPGLDPLLTVRENLRAAAALHGLAGPAAHAAIAAAAATLRLTDRLDDRVSTLSGGLVRRADLGRAVLHRPAILLLDEPTAGLDLRARADFLAALHDLLAAPSGPAPTIVMTTHLMDEAEQAHRAVLMHHGRVVGDGPPALLQRELGGAVLRCQPADHTAPTDPEAAARAADLLRDAGLDVSVDRRGQLLARLPGAHSPGEPAPAVEHAVLALARAGIPFHVGPPTLGDVYLARTGDALDTLDAPDAPDGLDESPPQRHGSRRRGAPAAKGRA